MAVDPVGIFSDRGVVEALVEEGDTGGERREEEIEVGVEYAVDGVVSVGCDVVVSAFYFERFQSRRGDVEDDEEEREVED